MTKLNQPKKKSVKIDIILKWTISMSCSIFLLVLASDSDGNFPPPGDFFMETEVGNDLMVTETGDRMITE